MQCRGVPQGTAFSLLADQCDAGMQVGQYISSKNESEDILALDQPSWNEEELKSSGAYNARSPAEQLQVMISRCGSILNESQQLFISHKSSAGAWRCSGCLDASIVAS